MATKAENLVFSEVYNKTILGKTVKEAIAKIKSYASDLVQIDIYIDQRKLHIVGYIFTTAGLTNVFSLSSTTIGLEYDRKKVAEFVKRYLIPEIEKLGFVLKVSKEDFSYVVHYRFHPKKETKEEKKEEAKPKKAAKRKSKPIREKKKRVMNKGLQIAKLKQLLKKHGIEPDLVDLEALVDSTLTYRENKENVMKQLGISEKLVVKPSEVEVQEIEDAIRQAQMYHQMRSERAQSMDERKKAKIPKDVDAWFRHPERYDLPGVDYPDADYSVEDYVKDLKKSKKRKKK